MKLRFSSLLYLAIILITVGCSPNNMNSLVLDMSCEPPCWLGIQPGKTSTDVAESFLKANSMIAKSSIDRSNAQQYTPPERVFFDVRGGGGGSLGLANDNVFLIHLVDFKIRLGDMIEKYDQPEQVLILPYWEWDGAWYAVYLYPSKGISYRYVTKKADINQNYVSIQPKDYVTELIYCQPENMDQIIKSLVFGKPDQQDFDYSILLQQFKGYGTYAIIRPN